MKSIENLKERCQKLTEFVEDMEARCTLMEKQSLLSYELQGTRKSSLRGSSYIISLEVTKKAKMEDSTKEERQTGGRKRGRGGRRQPEPVPKRRSHSGNTRDNNIGDGFELDHQLEALGMWMTGRKIVRIP